MSAVIGLGVLIVGAVGVARLAAGAGRARRRRTAVRRRARRCDGRVRRRPHRRRRLRRSTCSPNDPGRDSPFDNSRPRPVPTVLDTLRARLDHDAFDARRLLARERRGRPRLRRRPAAAGLVAWIDELRSEGKRTARPLLRGERRRALEIAGIADRFDVDLHAVHARPRRSSRPSSRSASRPIAGWWWTSTRRPRGRARGRGAAGDRDRALVAPLRRSCARAAPRPCVADLQELLGPING